MLYIHFIIVYPQCCRYWPSCHVCMLPNSLSPSFFYCAACFSFILFLNIKTSCLSRDEGLFRPTSRAFAASSARARGGCLIFARMGATPAWICILCWNPGNSPIPDEKSRGNSSSSESRRASADDYALVGWQAEIVL